MKYIKWEQEGFEMYGFKLGQSVICNDTQRFVVGFSQCMEFTPESYVIAITSENKESDFTLFKNGYTDVGLVSFSNNPIIWVNTSQINKTIGQQFMEILNLEIGEQFEIRSVNTNVSTIATFHFSKDYEIVGNEEISDFVIDNYISGIVQGKYRVVKTKI